MVVYECCPDGHVTVQHRERPQARRPDAEGRVAREIELLTGQRVGPDREARRCGITCCERKVHVEGRTRSDPPFGPIAGRRLDRLGNLVVKRDEREGIWG